jgi:hypothetical protein
MYEYARDLNKGREVDLRYAPPGLEAKTFCPAGERELACDPYLLCVGQLDDLRKNIGLLLAAYALIPEGARGCEGCVKQSWEPLKKCQRTS